jgi:hypothetical protein
MESAKEMVSAKKQLEISKGESEEDIIRNIIKKREIEYHEGSDEKIVDHILSYGDRQLTITFHAIFKNDVEVRTEILNKKPDSTEKDSGVTLLYKAAKTIMETEMKKYKLPLNYTLSTVNPRLTVWALTKGLEIFKWDEHDVDEIAKKTCLKLTKNNKPMNDTYSFKKTIKFKVSEL